MQSAIPIALSVRLSVKRQ